MNDKKEFAQPEITSYEHEEIVVPIAVTKPVGSGVDWIHTQKAKRNAMEHKRLFTEPEITSYEREEIVAPVVLTLNPFGGSNPD